MKVSELEGPLLDLWVARASKLRLEKRFRKETNCEVLVHLDAWGLSRGIPAFSTNWNEGGPILERMKIGLNTWHGDWGASFTFPVKHPTNPKRDPSHHWMKGPTPLIAAMRTYVSSVYGDEVPEEDQ